MKIYYSILALLIIFSCTPNGMKEFARSVTGDNVQSMVMIGESRKVVKKAILNFKSKFDDDFMFIDKGDTLGYVSQSDAFPIHSLFIFEDDINVYQEMDVYCSPCADEMIALILKDTRYNFKANDKINYISTTDLKAIMRLKSPEDNDQSCHQIRVYNK